MTYTWRGALRSIEISLPISVSARLVALSDICFWPKFHLYDNGVYQDLVCVIEESGCGQSAQTIAGGHWWPAEFVSFDGKQGRVCCGYLAAFFVMIWEL